MWNKWVFSLFLNISLFLALLNWYGKLFQSAGAIELKARSPYLVWLLGIFKSIWWLLLRFRFDAERVNRSCIYVGDSLLRAFQVMFKILNLILAWTGSQCSSFLTWEIPSYLCRRSTNRAAEFWCELHSIEQNFLVYTIPKHIS